MKGIVAFSFALRPEAQEPNPCNIRLAKEVRRLYDQENGKVRIVAQWEVARQLLADGIKPDLIVNPPDDGSYLDSEFVWKEAEEFFAPNAVVQVIPVAQPFLQLRKVKGMIRKDRFVVVPRRIRWIGFDKKSLQWWTRGPIRLFAYAVLQVTMGLRGFNGKQSAGTRAAAPKTAQA